MPHPEKLPLYFDAAATKPLHPEVLDAMLPYFSEIFGNPNSQHEYGQVSAKAISKARESVASIVHAHPEEIVFTSGATEAIQLAIREYWENNRDEGNHIVTVKTEHKAVLKTCEYLESLGVDVTYLDVDRYGQINSDQLRNALRPDTILACVMYVNNETGLKQDIYAFADICAERDVAFFTDSTQAIGHVTCDFSHPGITMACCSAHKLGGPKGVGFLYRTSDVNFIARDGTPFTAGIIGLERALRLEANDGENLSELLRSLEVSGVVFHELVPLPLRSKHITSIVLNAPPETIPKLSSLAYSKGAACQSGVVAPSHVYSLLSEQPDFTIRLSV